MLYYIARLTFSHVSHCSEGLLWSQRASVHVVMAFALLKLISSLLLYLSLYVFNSYYIQKCQTKIVVGVPNGVPVG